MCQPITRVSRQETAAAAAASRPVPAAASSAAASSAAAAAAEQARVVGGTSKAHSTRYPTIRTLTHTLLSGGEQKHTEPKLFPRGPKRLYCCCLKAVAAAAVEAAAFDGLLRV